MSKVKDHPFFGMRKENDKTVLEELDDLRKPRYDLWYRYFDLGSKGK